MSSSVRMLSGPPAHAALLGCATTLTSDVLIHRANAPMAIER